VGILRFEAKTCHYWLALCPLKSLAILCIFFHILFSSWPEEIDRKHAELGCCTSSIGKASSVTENGEREMPCTFPFQWISC